MKARHIVPLSRQAMEIFRELHAKTGRLQHVFPGLVNRKRPMSENAVNSALRRMVGKKQIICVDDLERRSKGLEVKDVLGLISYVQMEDTT